MNDDGAIAEQTKEVATIYILLYFYVFFSSLITAGDRNGRKLSN